MSKRQRRKVHVTNHALLRFLERAGGVDIEALRASIETSLKRAIASAGEIGAVNLVVSADGLKYIVRDGVVLTVLDEAMPVRMREPG